MLLLIKEGQSLVEAKVFNIIGDVRGKTALMIDDMIDTAGTLAAVAAYLMESGAKEVYALVTHAVFSGKAIERIQNSPLKEVWITDTIPLQKSVQANYGKIHCISVAPLVAEAMKRIYSKGSVSALFE